MRLRVRATRSLAVSGVLAAIALSGCGTGGSEPGNEASDSPQGPAIAEPIAVTYDGGIYLLDGKSLTTADELKLDGFNRLNPAGDDHHLMVSTKDGFRVLDAAHGDWTDLSFPAAKPGHVVRHAGHTVLFADGSGEITTFDPHQLADGAPQTDTYKTAAPHHGVAIELSNGQLVHTLGTEDKRTGIAVLDAARKEITRNEDCPGIHGEAAVQGEAVVVGCQTGALVYRDGKITKVTSPTPYGRIGNLSGSAASPIALGDYKQDEDAELERPRQISLVDTRNNTLRLLDIGTSYTFRSLARGPQGEALVLGTDGQIHVIDPIAGTQVRTIPVTAPWEEPLQWQQPRPALFVRGADVYVSDTAAKKVHRIDLATGTVAATATLPETPNELSGTLAD
ncbi:zinc metallochaperone AztD [Nocardia sp. BMG51109]|uniref:zinc metallochaperone AztD n=1 Tax=Nocardia sp. BMG51109 TaxID=1056816 RepID=UPI000464DD1E|nr:zinc metallochaperone AztD [Nocardia sp. BMG51109]